jgi:hypothetical protein
MVYEHAHASMRTRVCMTTLHMREHKILYALPCLAATAHLQVAGNRQHLPHSSPDCLRPVADDDHAWAIQPPAHASLAINFAAHAKRRLQQRHVRRLPLSKGNAPGQCDQLFRRGPKNQRQELNARNADR